MEYNLEELFDFFKQELEEARANKTVFYHAGFVLELLEQNSSIYFNLNIENIFTLNQNKDKYKQKSLDFLSQNIDLYFEVLWHSKDKSILVTLIKFLPLTKPTFLPHIKLAITLAHITYSKDGLWSSLQALASKAFYRYDLGSLLKQFSLSSTEVPPYKELNAQIKNTLHSPNKNNPYFLFFVCLTDYNFALYQNELPPLPSTDKIHLLLKQTLETMPLPNKQELEMLFMEWIQNKFAS